MHVSSIPLIPREVLFGNPDHIAVRLSPDGRHISFIAPKEGVLNVWVAPREDISNARCITDDQGSGIRSYFWAYNNSHIIYIQDRDGSEDWHLYSVNLETLETIDLTPRKAIQARVVETSEKFPDEMLIAINDRDPAYHDLYRINIVTGKSEQILENLEFSGFVTDADFNIRFAMRARSDGGLQVLQLNQESWLPWMDIDPDDVTTTSPLGFDKTGKILYMLDSRRRNTAALMTLDLEKNESKVLYENPRADVSDSLVKPSDYTVQAAASTYERKEWKILDPSIEADLNYLRNVASGELEITSRTHGDDFWIAAYLVDDGPVKYYLYDRLAQKATYLLTSTPRLEQQPLVPMHSVVIKARDGLDMVSYYSLPKDAEKPMPLVLDVHGGPWARDTWGYNGTHQWLANRGYAVLSVNFRGSTGVGKDHTNAGHGEWGAKMHDDLLDAVQWAIDEGIADPDKIAIYGASYGGYAVLHALTATPEVFACGVDIVGPSNLVTLIESVPPYWKPILEMFKVRIGADPETKEGQEFLKQRSPLTHVANIKRPLLIGQGANDPRVKQAESDQIVDAMKERGIPHTYVLYPDEGHGFVRPENRLAFFAIAEAFLAKNLGGRCEPVQHDLKGSSHVIVTDSYDLAGSK